MKLLFAAAEIFPFAKTGGLADVAYALPKALAKEIETLSVMPFYRFIERERFRIRPLGEHATIHLDGNTYDIEFFTTVHESVRYLFVYHEILCDRDAPYGPAGGSYADNDLRFAIFSHAIVALCERLSIDILHLNDWHTALAAPLLRDAGLSTKTVFTIHNLAYQGIFPRASMRRIGLKPHHFEMEDMEYYGSINWMKGGIAHSDAVTTVSPSYAVEIQRSEFGCGLDGFLRKHRGKLTGILNGIDERLYDPSEDPALPYRFDEKRLMNKQRCKRAFLDEIDIKKYQLPLFVFIGRFVEQKGIDWILKAADLIGELPILLAVLGEGEERFHRLLDEAAERSANIHVRYGYDEALSHRMYAAADFLLMPSRFEPCGLNQMIAMRYGTIPVVHRVGGLRDSVHPYRDEELQCGKGVVFETPDASAMIEAIKEAMALFSKRRLLNSVRKFDMRCDFSIRKCAARYLDLYRSLS